MMETDENSQVKHQRFARRLGAAMEAANMTTTDLHRAMGVTYEMARRYTLGLAMPRGPGKMTRLAVILGCEEGYLTGKDDYFSRDLACPVPAGRRIPVLSRELVCASDRAGFKDMITVPGGDFGPNAYAYYLDSDAMQGQDGRYIEQGAALIVDPDRVAVANSIVLASINADIVVGHFQRFGGVLSVRPSNSRYPTLTITEAAIAGVVVRWITESE